MLLKRVGSDNPAANSGDGAMPASPPPPSSTSVDPYPQSPSSFGSPVMPTAVPQPGTAPTIPGQGLPGVIVDKNKLRDFRNQIVQRIQASMGPNTILTRDDKTIRELASKFKTYYDQLQLSLPADQQRALFDEILAEMVGFGPLEPLLSDESITEI